MDKCRLCMKHSKNLMCLFDNNDPMRYADMVTLIANVKISKEDGITDQICRVCQRKTKELYDFKLQVERSYVALQDNCNLKRVNFSNIDDIKFSIEITENDFKRPIPVDLTENLMKNSEQPFNYKDTVIKKLPFKKETIHLSVLDFLKTIKEEDDDDYGDDYSFEVEVDYDPDLKKIPDFILPKQPKNRSPKKITKSCKENKKDDDVVLCKPFKPIYLADYTLVPGKRKPNLKVKPNDRKLLICPYCGKLTKTLKAHLLIHSEDKPHKCDKCSNAFVTFANLKKHIENTHSPRTVKCGLCTGTFTNKHALKSHMTSHCNEKKHACNVCKKAFKSKSHLLRHVKLVHNLGTKPWKCEQCSDTFNFKHGLNHHMRVHSGERPYRCEICSQPYSYKHDFNRHCLKKHGVCFKRRSVYIMSEEVLLKEQVLMRDLMLRLKGIIKDDKPINPFEGPQAALAFDQMIKAIQSGKVVVDLHF